MRRRKRKKRKGKKKKRGVRRMTGAMRKGKKRRVRKRPVWWRVGGGGESDRVEEGGGGESSLQEDANGKRMHSSRRWWKEGNFMIMRYPDGSVVMTLETKETVKLTPSVLFAEAREEHQPLLSDIFFQWPSTFVRLGNMSTFSRRLALVSLVSFVELLEDVSLPEATPEDFASVYGGLAALGSYQLEVDWLRKRIDQMAVLLELPAWRDRLEKVNK
ncbi:hypothetical protein RHGRI_010817 [Rhododendron griersonianum]|uniref:Uncharacterized protein n=1 Tax=Rhododendron griersonianum TaxID=479676 RepID=A0AAV6KKR0_9ERIC|nr:hypothetical protein RHGRI_010817 [Rhododendron griersonianum]